MKKHILPLLITLLVTTTLFYSCKEKKEDPQPTSDNVTDVKDDDKQKDDDVKTDPDTPPVLIENSIIVDTKNLFETTTNPATFMNAFQVNISFKQVTKKQLRLYFPNTNPNTGDYTLIRQTLTNKTHGVGKIAMVFFDNDTTFIPKNEDDVIKVVNNGSSFTITFDNIEVISGTKTKTMSGIIKIETKTVALVKEGSVTAHNLTFNNSVTIRDNPSNIEYQVNQSSLQGFSLFFKEKPTSSGTYTLAETSFPQDGQVKILFSSVNGTNVSFYSSESSDVKTITITYTSEDNFSFTFDNVTFTGSNLSNQTIPSITTSGSGSIAAYYPASL